MYAKKFRSGLELATKLSKHQCNERRGSSALLTTPSGHIRQREIAKVIRNPLDLKSKVRICTRKVQEKNEQNCWFLETSSLNWVFFDAYQLYVIHRTLKSCRKPVRVRSDLNLWFEYCGSLFSIKWIYLIERRSLDQKYKFSIKIRMSTMKPKLFGIQIWWYQTFLLT